MTRFLLALALLALPAAALADEKPAAKTQRALYTVRHGNAPAMAEALAKHFKGEADISVLPGNTITALLVSGPATAEAVKLLEELDRAPKSVAVEVIVAEVFTKKVDDAKQPADP